MTKRVLIDLLGLTFGRLTVVARAANRGARNNVAVWCCACACGAICDVVASNLRSGASTSCGCTRKKHGKWRTPEYSVWRSMTQRCTCATHPAYHNYGGRGISVAESWLDFANFYRDMGSRPTPSHSLERLNNDLGYSRDNCVWATRVEQGRNRRTSKVTAEVARLVRQSAEHQKVLAARYGVSQATISRIRNKRVWSEA
jgi:hypothetical protein